MAGGNDLDVKFGATTTELDSASTRAANDIKKVSNAVEQTRGPLGRMADYFKYAKAEFKSGWDQGWAEHLKKGANEASGSAQNLTKSLTETVGSVDGLLGAAMKVAAVGALVAVPAGLVAWGEKFGDIAEKLDQMSMKLGMSAQEVSQWGALAQTAGMSTEAFASSAQRLERSMVAAANGGKTQTAMFNELGIKISETSSVSEVMLQVADKFKGMEDGPKKTAMAMSLMGRAGANMIPILNGGSKALKEQFDMANSYGAVVTEEFMQAGRAMDDAMDQAHLGMQGLQQTLFTALAPAIVATVEAMNDFVKELIASYREGGAVKQALDVLNFALKSVGSAIQTVIVAFKVLWFGAQAAISGIVGGVMTLGNVISRVASGDFEGAKASWNNGWKATGSYMANQWGQAQDAVGKYQTSVRKLWAGMPKGDAKGGGGGIGDLDIPGLGKKGGNKAANEARKAAQQALQAEIEAMNFKQELAQEDFNEQMRLEEQKLSKIKAFYGEDSREYQRELENKVRMERRHQQQVVQETQRAIQAKAQLQQSDADSQSSVNDTKLQQERAHFEALDQMGQVSNRQREEQNRLFDAREVANQVSHEDAIFNIKKQAMEEQLRIQGLPVEQQTQINAQLLQLEKDHQNKLIQIRTSAEAQASATADKAMQQSMQKWQNMFSPVESALNGFLGAMITRSQTFGQALLQIGDQLLISLVQQGTKALFRHIAFERAKSTATAAGAAQRVAVETSAAATGTKVSALSAVKQIAHKAAVAAAGAYAAIAAIPVVGPFLAPAIAAAALYGVFRLAKGVMSAEGGMGDVPYDNAPFLLHKNEMVLPAKYANPLRTMLAGAGPRQSNMAAAAQSAGQEARSEVRQAAAAPAMAAIAASSKPADFHYHDHSGTMTPDQIHSNRSAIAQAMKTAHREGHFAGFMFKR